jgi:PBP1b-binding outer membrane lipoprotein LpoB
LLGRGAVSGMMKAMKRTVSLLLVALVSTFVLVGCQKKEEAPKAPEVPKEAPKQ